MELGVAIISLGCNCQTAYQIRRKGLCRTPGPIDWFICPLNSTINLLRNEFKDFMNKDNFEVLGNYENKTLIVLDRLYGVKSFHNFSYSSNFQINHNEYIIFKNKLDNKISEFYSRIRGAAYILFIIHGERCMLEDYYALVELLKQERKGRPFKVWVCGYFSPLIEGLNDEHLSFYQFRKLHRVSDPKESWKGSNDEWDKFLEKVNV